MKPPLPLVCAVAAALAFASCQKKVETSAPGTASAAAPAAAKPATLPLVKETERSKNFAAVHKHLELGGTLYGYVDVEGDIEQLADSIQKLTGEAAKMDPNAAVLARQDLKEIARMLGLTDIKAFGVSSVPDDAGFFRNRAFLFAPGERHGLMAGLGGKPGPFKHLNLAPADAAFYAETELDMAAVYKTIKDVVTKVAGEPASTELERALRKAGEAATLSFIDLFHGLKGHSAVVVRIDATKTFQTPGRPAVALPSFAVLACVDGVGKVMEPSFQQAREFRRSDKGELRLYELRQRLPLEGVVPTFIVDGTQLFFTTSVAFFEECRAQKTGLAQTAEFQKAVAHVGREGNGLFYLSPRFSEQVRQIEKLNPELPPQMKSALAMVLSQLPQANQPTIAVRTNLDDGILFRAYMDRSFKKDVAMLAMYNPATVGLMAAMAIPAFQKVRTASQEKAVLNNLRQLAAAADQYYLENGVRTARYDDLVGPTKYVKVIQPVAGENYRALRFEQGQPLRVRLANGRMIEYKP